MVTAAGLALLFGTFENETDARANSERNATRGSGARQPSVELAGAPSAPRTLARAGVEERSQPDPAPRAAQNGAAPRGTLEVFATGPDGSLPDQGIYVSRVGSLENASWRARGEQRVGSAEWFVLDDPSAVGIPQRARTDPDGRAVLGLSPGLFWVRAQALDGVEVISYSGEQRLDGFIAAVLPSERTTVELTVHAAASVVVRVSAPDRPGERLDLPSSWSAADISLSRRVGTSTRSWAAVGAEEDRVTFENLAPGPYEVEPAPMSPWAFAPTSVELGPGERRTVDVQLERRPHAALRLRAKDGRGAALPLRLRYELRLLQQTQDGRLLPSIARKAQSGFVGPEGKIELTRPGSYTLDLRMTRITPGRSQALAATDVRWDPRTVVLHEDMSVTPDRIEVTVSPKGALCEVAGTIDDSEDGPRSQYALEYTLADGTTERLPLRPSDWPRFGAILDLGRLADPTARLVDENRLDDGPLADVSLMAPRTDWTVDLRR